MYEELVKAMRETRERVKSNPGVAMFVPPYQLSEAADAIEELQKAVYFHKYNSEFWEDKYNSLADEKWIPVTERLPKEQETVLTWGEQGIILLNWRHDNKWCGCLGNVTHWMPLPEPPKEEA